MMTVSRREAFAVGAGAIALALTGLPHPARSTELSDKLINEFTGGKKPTEGKIKLELPVIAENGNTVPVSFAVDSPMTKDNHVVAVLLVAEENPGPVVGHFNFTEMSGSAEAATRMRLAKSQDVVAVAKMSDGSLYTARKNVKVTIGGCGG